MQETGIGPGASKDDRPGPILRLHIANDIGDLCRAMESVDGFLEGQEVEGEAAFTVRLAVEEIVTNIIKYAYDDTGAHGISLEIRLAPGRVVIQVADDGREFDPLAASAPDLDLSLEEKEVGGVGIHLVRTMAESLEYARVGGKNVLTAAIRRKPRQ